MRRRFGLVALSALLGVAEVIGTAVLAAPVALAQPPDLRAMSGRPLPVPDLPAGTVTVRLARQMPANAVPDVEVDATLKRADGGEETRTARSGAGRSTSFSAAGRSTTLPATSPAT